MNEERKNNVVMALLHQFICEAVRMKSLELLAKAQYSPENNSDDIEKYRASANEFIRNVENLPFESLSVDIGFSGHMPKDL